MSEQKPLVQEFETRAEKHRFLAQKPGLSTKRHEGRAASFVEAAQSVRNVLTEEEARVLRERVLARERFQHQYSPQFVAETRVFRKCLNALTDPEPQKLYRGVYVETGEPTADVKKASVHLSSIDTEEWKEVSTDNGKTWERVES